jgi:hypothetical protein
LVFRLLSDKPRAIATAATPPACCRHGAEIRAALQNTKAWPVLFKHLVRSRDFASSSLASFKPDIAAEVDQLPDYLAEKINALVEVPRSLSELRSVFMEVIADALKEANLQAAERSHESAPAELVEGLRVLAGPEEENRRVAFRAACVLKQLGLDNRSDQELADHYGVVRTRAAGHSIRRKVERLTGLRCRSSKSDRAREKCKLKRTGTRRIHETNSLREFFTAAISGSPNYSLSLPEPAFSSSCPSS